MDDIFGFSKVSETSPHSPDRWAVCCCLLSAVAPASQLDTIFSDEKLFAFEAQAWLAK
jgi:hypothetical protein